MSLVDPNRVRTASDYPRVITRFDLFKGIVMRRLRGRIFHKPGHNREHTKVPDGQRAEGTAAQQVKVYRCVLDGLWYSSREDASTHVRFAHPQERDPGSVIRERAL